MSGKIEVTVPEQPADNSSRLQTWKESRKDLFLVGSSLECQEDTAGCRSNSHKQGTAGRDFEMYLCSSTAVFCNCYSKYISKSRNIIKTIYKIEMWLSSIFLDTFPNFHSDLAMFTK